MFGLQPESAGSYLLTARMLFRQEFQPVALEYTQKALTIDPKLPLAYFLAEQIHMFLTLTGARSGLGLLYFARV